MAADILNCPWRDGRCPGNWAALPDAGTDPARECPVCGHPVVLCRDRDESLFLSRHGRRVAVADGKDDKVTT
jgi:hypothetical protein